MNALMLKFTFGALVASLLWSAAPAAHAKKKIRNTRVLNTVVQEPVEEYIRFENVQNQIDCENLGGALYWGNYASGEGTIEVNSNRNVRLDFTNGADLTTNAGSLPTTFHYAVRGAGKFDETEFVSPDDYKAMPDKESGASGTILFAANAPKGLKTKVSATRRGLNDRAGKYQTQIVLSWSRF